MTQRINDNSAWRAFEDSELTHSAAHYLITLHQLRLRQGYARVTDVAEALGISRGAASRAIALLKERGWIEEDPHRMILLTEPGRARAGAVERNFQIIEDFLQEVLGVPHDAAHADACKIEHLLSPATIGSIHRMARMLESSRPLKKRLQERLGAIGGDPVEDFALESASNQD